MKIGLIGVGRMGANIARRLMRTGHETVVYDRDTKAMADVVKDGAVSVESIEAMGAMLASPAIYWVMLPAGTPTEETIAALAGQAVEGDIIIDGGNSFYKDDIRRAKALRQKGIPLCRCRNLGRRMGPRARLLHDDRRCHGGGPTPRADLRGTCPRAGHDPAHP